MYTITLLDEKSRFGYGVFPCNLAKNLVWQPAIEGNYAGRITAEYLIGESIDLI
jgi:hypothetical protein